ncbi:beta-N-acetylhexosaminidase [Chimaeribacter coloradensis]|uniref:N-acetyl-beta-glucosaminidase n=1 Tax=Chimaeribacter coloradensis TaxID=2060068 RepID=A0A2N5DU16_9GAMM|nr:family 20 glycosylhydrolase [Chimaeribacter coloradensis]PLR30242.1 beta-N-acetylhexosaminidase [Chimaeribacter coloradensis]
MKRRLPPTLLASLILLSPALRAQPAGDLPLMPWPQRVEANQQGSLMLDNRLTIGVSGDDLGPAVARWRQRIEQQTGWTLLPQADNPQQALIMVVIKQKVDPQPLPDSDERYQLTITPQGAVLNAETRFGALRGMETLLQLIHNNGSHTALPLVRIIDAPRFPWRGVLLDSARHFLPVSDIKRQLDGMAAAKLNVFHWHLTDDQGWRFASTHYPKLQEQASDGQFYSVAQMKEVVAYATSLGIRVVPEIDLPGHASAIAVAYPELVSAPGPYLMQREWGVHQPTLDPSRQETYQFVDTILGEVAAIFPDPYLHIGGDEVDPTQWNASPTIQAFMQRNNLADSHALQAYFNRRLTLVLGSWQRTMVGWDEIHHPDLPKTAVIQSWQGPDALGTVAQEGYKGLLSTGFYLDQPHSTAYHYRNEVLPQPLWIDDQVHQDEQAQSWAFTMPRLKGKPVEGSVTLIEGPQGWRGFIDFSGKSRRAVRNITWRDAGVTFQIDTWMGDTRPVLTLKNGTLAGYFLIGNVRYPVSGKKLASVPAGTAPVVPDRAGVANILGGEAALWAEAITPQILDLKLWPRGFAVAERLWSARDVQDEQNMYQRLAAVDAWSVVSVGLQQHAETARQFTRLAQSTQIAPLQVLAEAIEPAQYYTRLHLKFQAGNYHQFEPLNRFADALPPESDEVRRMNLEVQQLLADRTNSQAADALRQRFTRWQANSTAVAPLLAGNSRLVPLQPVAADISALSVLGQRLVDVAQRGSLMGSNEVKRARQLLDSAAAVRDEVVIAAVYPLEALLDGITRKEESGAKPANGKRR